MTGQLSECVTPISLCCSLLRTPPTSSLRKNVLELATEGTSPRLCSGAVAWLQRGKATLLPMRQSVESAPAPVTVVGSVDRRSICSRQLHTNKDSCVIFQLLTEAGGVSILGMRHVVSIIILSLCFLCPGHSSAQVIDHLLGTQAATTAVGARGDTTTTMGSNAQDRWSTRTLSVTTSGSCVSAAVGNSGVAIAGDGALAVENRNSKGVATVRWTLKDQELLGLLLKNVRLALEIAPGLNSAASAGRIPSQLSIRANLAFGRDRGLTHERKVFVPTNHESKTVIFSLQPLTTAGFISKTRQAVRTLSLSFEELTGCDGSFYVRNIRFISTPPTNSKRRMADSQSQSERDGSAPLPGQSFPASQTVAPEPSPPPNPCETEEARRVLAEVCDGLNRLRSSCGKEICKCNPDFRDNTFSISQSHTVDEAQVGQQCHNLICGAPGICSEEGYCEPAHLVGLSSPIFDVKSGVFSFKGLNSRDCIDREKRTPTVEELCRMTAENIDQAVRATFKIGKPCVDYDGNNGVCNEDGKCLPPVRLEPTCSDKSDCGLCSRVGETPRKICWMGKCVPEHVAARDLCTNQVSQDSDKFCLPCVVTLSRNSAGECGTTIFRTLTPDRRRGVKVYMDATSCEKQGVKGECRLGTCLTPGRPLAPPTAAATVLPY
jgi:hypothetical protein